MPPTLTSLVLTIRLPRTATFRGRPVRCGYQTSPSQFERPVYHWELCDRQRTFTPAQAWSAAAPQEVAARHAWKQRLHGRTLEEYAVPRGYVRIQVRAKQSHPDG